MDSQHSKRLLEFIQSLPNFVIHEQIDGEYGHVGATLADAVLQSNNNYERNVRHRIKRILSVYPESKTVKSLQLQLSSVPTEEYLDWKGPRKSKPFEALVSLLECNGVDSEEDLKRWLTLSGSRAKLLLIPYIGPKTTDYLKILVGLPAVAMDRHLIEFLARAGINELDYDRGQRIVHGAADLMSVNPAHLDHSIWRYMSEDKTSVQKAKRLPICP